MDPELVADAVAFADPMQGNPGPWRVRDVVVHAVARRPARHRARLHAINQAAFLRVLEDWYETGLEIEQVFVHAATLIPPDESADRTDTEQDRGIEHPTHELLLLLSQRRILVQQIVEIREVR